MKKSWKCWLGTLTACALSFHSAWGQDADSYSGSVGVASTGSGAVGAAPAGSVRVGGPLPRGPMQPMQPIQQAQGFMNPEAIFDNAPPYIEDAFIPSDQEVAYASTQPIDDIVWRVGRTNLDRLGMTDGYTNIDAFVPLAVEGGNTALWFLMPQANINDNGRGGANVLFGRRFYSASDDRVYGAAAAWHFDAMNRNEYNAFGGSFESLGQFFSLRSNFLVPVGTQVSEYDEQFVNPRFVGSNLILDRQFNREAAYQYYDVEASAPMPVIGRYGFDVGLGAYYLSSKHDEDSPGFSLRLQSQVTEDFWIQGLLTTDDIFESRFSLNMELTLPDGMPSRWMRRNPVASNLTASFQRYGRVPVSFRQKLETVTATGGGGGGGGALNIAFIDPNRVTAGGTGTSTDPFQSLLEYMSLSAADRAEFDVVYVRRRDQGASPTLDDTNLNTTITLLDFQILVGDGDLPGGRRPTITTAQGAISLPGTPGALPVLTNSAALGSSVITLANANEVTGLSINGTQTGIGIEGSNIDSFNIHDVFIDEVTAGIQITSNTAPVLGIAGENYGILRNIEVTNPITPTLVPSTAGISVLHSAGVLDLLVDNNTVTGFLGEDSNDNNILESPPIVPVEEDTNGNAVLDPGVGISIVATGGTINADNPTSTTRPTGIINNDPTGNEIGLQLRAENLGTTFNMLVAGNVVTGNETGATITSANDAVVRADVLDNTFEDNTGTGFIALADDATLNLLSISGNTFSDNGLDGVQLIAANGANFNLAVPEDANADGLLTPGEDLNGNGVRDPGEDVNGNGVLDAPEDLNGNGQLDLGFSLNTVAGNARNGVVVLADNAVFDANIGAAGPVGTAVQGNVITNNGGTVQVANQLVTDGSGVLVTTANGGLVNLEIEGNQITLNELAGIEIAPDNGIVNIESIFRNNISDNIGDAVLFNPTNGGSFTLNNFTNNTTEGNGGAILNIGGNGGVIDLGVIENNIFDRTVNGTAGILFSAVNADIVGVFRNNLFIGSANNADLTFGIGGEIQGGTVDLLIENNVFDGNADAAIGLILGVSDDRTGTGTGTPAEGDGADGDIRILNNVIVNTRLGDDPRFDGAGISLQLEGQENDILNGQNDIDGDGIPDGPTIPLPDGSDVTTNVQPAPTLSAVISGNLIGTLTLSEDLNGNGVLDRGEDLDGDGVIDAVAGNDGSGIDIRASGDSTVTDLLIGAGPGGLRGNIIANNGDPTAAGNDPLNGDGVRIRRSDNAIIDNTTINGNIIQNNLNDGIDIAADNNGIPFGVEEILNFAITNNQILNNGFLSANAQGVVTQGTAGRGIQLRADAGSVFEIDIADNIISGNRMSGIEARTFTDSHRFVGGGRDSNVSTGGGDNGVIFGVWERNQVTNNGFITNEDTNRNGLLEPSEDLDGDGVLDILVEGHGIALGRVDFVDPDNPAQVTEGWNNGGTKIPDQDGDGIPDLPVLTVRNNVISGNGEDGLHIFTDKQDVFSVAAQEPRTSRVNVESNDIVGNGEDGISIHNASGGSATLRGNFDNNLITENGLYSGVFSVTLAGGNQLAFIGDGVEIFTSASARSILSFDQNRIKDNNGRGVNILTSDSGYLTGVFDRNIIGSNAREGFYLLNAPFSRTVLGVTGLPAGTTRTGYTDDTWMPDFDSNHEVFNWGHFAGDAGNTPPAVFQPFLAQYIGGFVPQAPVSDIVLTSNIIDNNGGVVPDADGEDPYSTLGGLVIRIGSSTDSTGITAPSFPETFTDFQGRENSIVGGVRARIEDNRVSGNVGRDVFFDGFVGTMPPTVDNLPDPLIRFDLQFRNNRGGSIDVDGTNFSVFYTNTAPNNFGGNNVKRPNPPFNPASIPRSATNNLGFIGPLGPFPGFGPRTLRIELDGSVPDAFGNSIGNNTFNLIYSDFSNWLSAPLGTLFDPIIVPNPIEQGLFL